MADKRIKRIRLAAFLLAVCFSCLELAATTFAAGGQAAGSAQTAGSEQAAGSAQAAESGPAAEKPSGRVIKIGYIDYEGFFNLDENGEVASGYGVELLSRISAVTGWRYEYHFDSFANHLENLKNGKIDLICHAQKTPEREESFLFSKYSTGSESSVLYAKKDDDRFYYNDFTCFDGMTVGFLEGSFQNDEFAAFANSHHFTYKSLFYPTQEASFRALDKGEVDTIAMGSLGGVSGYKVVSLFGADPFYFMSGKSNGALIDTLDNALGQIYAEEPDFTAKLFNKYYSQTSASGGLRLTREEAAYIAQAKPLVVGLMAGREPLTGIDENGNAEGMFVDLMNLISQKSGLKFEYRFLKLGQTGLNFLTETDGVLVAGVSESEFSVLNQALLKSENLQEGSVVFVGRKGTEFSTASALTVALPAAFINGKKVVSKVYPNFKFLECTTNESCLKAIRDGRADVMLQNTYVIRECLQSPVYEDLEIFPAYSFPESEKIVAMPGSELLISIINKTLSSITDEEKNNVVIAHTVGRAYHAKTSEIMYKYRVPLIGIAVLLILVFGLSGAYIISRRKNILNMKKVNSKLEHSNLQLADAVKQADRANIAKSQFLARMSHEIRTPMNAIVGLTAIAKSHLDDRDRMQDYLGKIDTSSRVLLNIINDVLDMSAIESEKMKIDKSDFDLKQVLTGISTIYYSQCKDKGIRFELGADLKEELLIGDSLRVNQVLLNLVSNAFKFTPSGGRISVTAKETERRDKKVFIRFEVSDTGCGMSEDMLSRLFKPFEQESSQTAKQHGGSGLGLSIAKNLVEMMHGAIRVTSEKGRGTTFTVDLPFEISEKSLGTMTSDHMKDLRALVVDDDVAAQEYTGIILKRIGVPFTFAKSGEEALALLEQEKQKGSHFDICFVDWKMPGMSGIELTQKIRQSFSKDMMVIIVSAYDLSEVQDEAKEAGADVFVTKPLFQSTVFNLLMQLSGGAYTKETADPDTYDFTGHRVLLAEDNDLNSEIAIELLDLVHMSVDRAANGKEAVDMFNAAAPGTYGCVLMDVQMPVMDGYEATKAIRAGNHPEAKTMPIIAMTANAFSSDVSAAISAGMNGHVAKPIDTKNLYQTLFVTIQKQKKA